MAEPLYNKIDKKILKARIERDETGRQTYAFYKYVSLADPGTLRDKLYERFVSLGVLGRIYLAEEGINAQFSLQDGMLATFEAALGDFGELGDVRVQRALFEEAPSFHKLTIKVREQLVADGLDGGDSKELLAERGEKLSPAAFDAAMDEAKTIVIDIRNHYEHEVGRFEDALCLPADTFRELLPQLKETLSGREDHRLLLYCTGGIRCEKASAYLRRAGFRETYQLDGGILGYAHDRREQGHVSRFKGKNFVFDNRLGERVTTDVLSQCHQCDAPSDHHVNCRHEDCHLLFIQCPRCVEYFEGCCSHACRENANLPLEEQRKRRRARKKSEEETLSIHKARAARSRVDRREGDAALQENDIQSVL